MNKDANTLEFLARAANPQNDLTGGQLAGCLRRIESKLSRMLAAHASGQGSAEQLEQVKEDATNRVAELFGAEWAAQWSLSPES